jgi:sugar phosphate isomerase/epimerase
VKQTCNDAGLTVSAYGSYYRAGVRDDARNPDFEHVLDTANTLGTSRIRVWAGNRASADASADERQRVVDDLRAACASAAGVGTTIGLEYHDHTLADTPGSALALCDAVRAPNLRCNWQPRVSLPRSAHLGDIEMLRPHLGDVHVFHVAADRSRLPLSQGVEDWCAYLLAVSRGDATTRFASLEFVKDDDPEQLLGNARALHEVIRRVVEGADAA